jgi:hypothetical protein
LARSRGAQKREECNVLPGKKKEHFLDSEHIPKENFNLMVCPKCPHPSPLPEGEGTFWIDILEGKRPFWIDLLEREGTFWIDLLEREGTLG